MLVVPNGLHTVLVDESVRAGGSHLDNGTLPIPQVVTARRFVLQPAFCADRQPLPRFPVAEPATGLVQLIVVLAASRLLVPLSFLVGVLPAEGGYVRGPKDPPEEHARRCVTVFSWHITIVGERPVHVLSFLHALYHTFF